MPQWSAQIVSNRIGEGFQFLVGGFELCGALNYALLQFLVEATDFLYRSLPLSYVHVEPEHAHGSSRFVENHFRASRDPADFSIIAAADPPFRRKLSRLQ